MTTLFLKCGCAGNARTLEGEPACAVHGCTEVVESPDLAGRKARCEYCGDKALADSHLGLAFFRHRPEMTTDSYYCGCRGWD